MLPPGRLYSSKSGGMPACPRGRRLCDSSKTFVIFTFSLLPLLLCHAAPAKKLAKQAPDACPEHWWLGVLFTYFPNALLFVACRCLLHVTWASIQTLCLADLYPVEVVQH